MKNYQYDAADLPSHRATAVVIDKDGIRHPEEQCSYRFRTGSDMVRHYLDAIAAGAYGAGGVTIELTLHREDETHTVAGIGPDWAAV